MANIKLQIEDQTKFDLRGADLCCIVSMLKYLQPASIMTPVSAYVNMTIKYNCSCGKEQSLHLEVERHDNPDCDYSDYES